MSEEYAFPNISTEKDESGFPVATTEQQGMTLHDWYIGRALTGLMQMCKTPADTELIGAAAYQAADLVMAEREKRNERST